MSGIVGLFYLNGRPVAREEIQSMTAAMAAWGPDGCAIHCDGPVGLGSLLLHTTPESRHEKQPLSGADGRLSLVATARLDNREELCAALGVPPSERAQLPDSALILRAYEAWGETCVHRLLGDWSFAVWDAPRRRLFLARDHHGNTGLCYYHSSSLFAFASSLKGLLALPNVPKRPNPLRIAQILVSWPGDGIDTAYEDLRRLPPAHQAVVTPEGADIRRYWRMEDAPEVRLGSDQEYVESFLELFAEAVRCRLRSVRPVGATLSGGLDSGSVCAMAAPLLAARGYRLRAYTSIPLCEEADRPAGRHRFGDEGPFAESTSRFVGDMDHVWVRAESVSPLEGIRRSLEMHAEPSHAAGNQFWITALLEAARAHGCGVLLTGQGGNATLSWTPSAQRIARSMGLRDWGRIRRSAGLLGVAREVLLRPLLLPVRAHADRRRAGREPWRAYSAIHPAFARSLALEERMRESGHDPTFNTRRFPDSRAARLAILKPGSSPGGALWHANGSAHGLEARDPTLDKRLLEFCLGIPDDQYWRDGQERWLIRRAMEGRLPPEVLWNRRKGLQAADLARRLAASRREVEEALAQMEQSAPAREWLDLPRMRAVLEQTAGPVTPALTQRCMAILARGLSVGLFLRRFDP